MHGLFIQSKIMNATMLTNDMKIAIRSDIKPTKGLITREQIRKLVTNVMVDKEGIDIRNNIKEFKAYTIKALNEGGSSFNALSEVANDCKMKLHKIDIGYKVQDKGSEY